MYIIIFMLKRKINPVTSIFVLICVVMYLVSVKYPEFTEQLYLSDFNFNYHPWVILTYSIVHIDLGHLAANMIGIVVTGQIIWWRHKEPGKVTFILLLAGIIAGGVAILAFIPGESIGASAAVQPLTVFAIGDAFMINARGGEKKLKIAAYWIIGIIMAIVMATSMIPSNVSGDEAHVAGVIIGFLFLFFDDRNYVYRNKVEDQGVEELAGERVQE
jgi:membrane associated rhomboid family serine protease